MSCKASPGTQEMLQGREPDAFFVPSYLGSKGWVALRLDLADVDWGLVTELIVNAYRLIAPKRLAKQVQATPSWEK